MEVVSLVFASTGHIVHLAGVVKRHVDAYTRLHSLASAIESKAIRSNAVAAQLRAVAQIPGISGELFTHTLQDIQDVEDKLTTIQQKMSSAHAIVSFLRSPILVRSLEDADSKLSQLDHFFRTVGILGSMITTQRAEARLRADAAREVQELVLKALVALLSESGTHSLGVQLLLELETKLVDSSHAQVEIATVHDAEYFFAMGLTAYNVRPGMGGTVASFTRQQDVLGAARYFRKACTLGKIEAYRYLGDIYYEGKGIQGSFQTAFKIYQRGRALKDAASTFKLGWCYTFGHGVDVNRAMAIQLQVEAVEGECGEAIFELGTLKLHGKMVETSHGEAVRLLQKASKMGVFRAKGQLALCYNQGIVFDRDPKKAHELLREAFDGGDLMATTDLARCYETEEKYDESAKVYEDCMNWETWQGDFYKAYYGLHLIQGLGIEQNVARGKAIILDSTKSGSGISWHALGDCYRYGHGFKKDLGKAKEYYRRGASCASGVQGIVGSYFALGEMFEHGEGVITNTRRAYDYYLLAATRMCQVAQWKVANAFESGVGRTKDVHQAVHYFRLCANSGHLNAQGKTIDYYVKGHGLERSRVRARRMMEEAARNGNQQVIRWLRQERVRRFFSGCRSSSEYLERLSEDRSTL